MEKLKAALLAWDGVHTDLLIDIYQKNREQPDFFEKLILISQEQADLQMATTWLVKHHYDQKESLGDAQMNELFAICPQVTAWEAKLHLLQVMGKFRLSEKNLIPVEDFVRQCLEDEVKFVRAWAYHGLYELSQFNPELKREIRYWGERALETESASIKSKVRKILAKLEKEGY
ncbi:MAG: hypothetical protein AAFU64_03750 [Bacteroidota bacterium]